LKRRMRRRLAIATGLGIIVILVIVGVVEGRPIEGLAGAVMVGIVALAGYVWVSNHIVGLPR
jgi:hypothetical protein